MALKPCPFCGSKDIRPDIVHIKGTVKFMSLIKCDCCGAQTKAFAFKDMDDWEMERALDKTIAAWQRRASCEET